ncbi:TonB-dependent receptor [Pontibacter sp. SGAir0037]|uniref:TonB-dependent receptor n=1 Tax=Pontibacter sp. SGAir0037 TaxID=2571030 RepID=UPI0010CCCAB0|nr:TonB-dependent receptor [Pontibacter sp. SGAir0037]QCR24178.1 TonB-dependent receptor [Pontibacter sp. SGAir0037]
MIRIRYYFLGLLLLAATTSIAQMQAPSDTLLVEEQDCGLTISGKAIDHDTREPLVGATIYIPELQRAAITDEYGNYHFHHLCRNAYTLLVSYIGYENERISLKLSASVVRNLTMHTDARQLGTVEIRGQRLSEQAQASETLTGRALAETRGLSLGESLKKLTGVSSVQTGPNVSKPVIHGLFGNRVLIMNNGVRHESQQWGNEHAPEIDPLNAQEMTVIKGASGVRYGSDAIGGIVLVNPKPLPDSAGTRAELGLIGSTNTRMGTVSGMAEGRLPQVPLSWRLHASLKKGGSAQAPHYNLNNTAFEEQNLAATLAYTKDRYGAEVYYSFFHSKLGFLSSAHIGNLTDLANAIARSQPEQTGDFTYAINRPYQDVTHHLFKAKGFYKTGEAGQLQFTYGLQQNIRQEYDNHRNASGRAQLDLDLQTHTTELVWEHRAVANMTGSIGASTVWQNNSFASGTRDLLPFFTNFTAGLFITEKWQKDNLQLEAGLRYDHKDLTVKRQENRLLFKPSYEFHNLSGSLGAMYDLGYHLTLSSHIGYASRAPHTYELFAKGLHNSAATYEEGDPNLSSENALNTSATVSYHSNLRLNGEVSFYLNTINNYIYLQLQPDYVLGVGGAYLSGKYMQANALFWGSDINLQYNISKNLMLESKTSLVYAKNRDTNQYLPFITPGRTDNNLRYSFRNSENSMFAESYVAVGGTSVSKQYRSDWQSDPVAPAPDGYFLWHAEAGTTLKIGHQHLAIGITGNNLLNTAYRDYQNRLRYFADEIGRIIMFNIRIPLEFTKG